MKIAIFGATGKVGQHLVDQALERGDEVTAFVRDPSSKLTMQRHERLKVVQGDVQNPKDVEAGCDRYRCGTERTRSHEDFIKECTD
jgi:putative NADH-flavin reductase